MTHRTPHLPRVYQQNSACISNGISDQSMGSFGELANRRYRATSHFDLPSSQSRQPESVRHLYYIIFFSRTQQNFYFVAFFQVLDKVPVLLCAGAFPFVGLLVPCPWFVARRRRRQCVPSPWMGTQYNLSCV